MNKILVNVLLVLGSLIFLSACGNEGEAQSQNSDSGSSDSGSSIDQLSFSVYDVGSTGYAEFSAVANALTEDHGMEITLLPSGNGVGRMTMLRDETASIGKLGDEYQFGYRAEEEFSSKEWGPQDVRVVWGKMSYMNGAVMENSDIKTPQDLKGKKIPYLTGNSSINTKTDSLIAAGGLTWEDVERVTINSYADQAAALAQGEIDMATMLPGTATLVEIAEMDGIRWLELPSEDDEEAWEAIQGETPWLIPGEWDLGAGLTEGEPQMFMAYPYPVVARTDMDNDEVREFIERVVASYDNYKDATATTFSWGKDEVNTTPLGVPFHEGAVEYFKENEMWDEEKQQLNDELVEEGKHYEEAWEKVLELSEEEGISDDEFPDFWLENRDQFLQ